MAIISTGAIYKSLVFDGESSRDYGIYITGQAVYNAPERDVETINIPGRNGSFVLDKGRFQNIEVTYPAGIFADNEADFAQGISDFRNFLCSRNGYVRLTDDYNPDEYRMAVYKSGLDVSPAQLKAGEFKIVFDCKPQRYLLSGEEPITIGEWHETETASGEIASFEAEAGDAVKSLVANIEPIQNGEPWISALNTEPYQFRQVPTQSHEFGYEIDKLVGGTVAWNQHVKNGNFADTSEWGFSNGTATAQNNKLTFTGTASGGYMYQALPSLSNNHKILFSATTKSVTNVTSIKVRLFKDYGSAVAFVHNSIGNIAGIVDNNIEGNRLDIRGYVGSTIMTTGDAFEISNVQIIDLTQMFGSTIADYIYSLETANAGAGVAWFRKLFNKPYYAYNAGELKSVSGLVSHDMTGFNQWDEEWENGGISPTGSNYSSSTSIRSKNYNMCLPSTTYYGYCGKAGGSDVGIFFYDANKTFIQSSSLTNRTLTTPSNACWFRLACNNAYGATYGNDICINISWDNSRNGEYEPYELHSYPLDSDLTLRGIPKLDANNNLYYDGDTYASDGTVTRRYGVKTFDGTEDWYGQSAGSSFFYANLFDMKKGSDYVNSIICDKLTTISRQTHLSNSVNMVITGYYDVNNTYVGQNWVYVHINDSITTASELRTWLASNPITVVYELATPTTETADPYTNPQIVDRYGTEEYITTSIVPIGHSTSYANICPISGWDSVETYRCGHGNMYLIKFGRDTFEDVNGATHSTDSDVLTANLSSANGSAVITASSSILGRLASGLNGTYTYSFDISTSVEGFIDIGFASAGIKVLGVVPGWNRVSITSSDFNVTPKTFEIRNGGDRTARTIQIRNFMIEFGSTATSYEPYQGNTYTTDLNGTRYGGTLDVVSGVLTVDRAYKELTSADTAQMSVNHYAPIWRMAWKGASSTAKAPSSTAVTNIMSNAFNAVGEANRGTAGTCFISGSSSWIQFDISDTGISTQQEAYNYFFGLNPVVVYELATPTTVQLTAQEVELLVGLNQVWANSGDVTVEYGTAPNVLINPTLFESSPMLEVEGYGEIGVNGDVITIQNGELGEIKISDATQEEDVVLDVINLNANDAIYSISSQLPYATMSLKLADASGTLDVTKRSSVTGGTAYISKINGYASEIRMSPVTAGGLSFRMGLSHTYTTTLPLTITINGTATNCTLTLTTVYNGSANTISLVFGSSGFPESGLRITSKYFHPVYYGNSTKVVLPSPMYIDLDLGEAYGEVSDEITSFNSIVQMPANPPTLKAGANEITFDDTITDLKVIPRWWRV